MLLDVLPGFGVDRLLFVGGGATLERGPRGRFIDSPDFPEEYRQEAEADAEALSIFKHSGRGLKWSYLSPPPLNLVDGARTGIFRSEASGQPIMDGTGETRITIGDLAAAVVDAVENETFIRQRFTVAYGQGPAAPASGHCSGGRRWCQSRGSWKVSSWRLR